MRKLAGRTLLVLLTVALGIQLVPYGRAHANPPVVQEPDWDSARTRQLFMVACADCHSNETKWPWYSSVAPVSWLVARHVQEGRELFNVSEWSGANESGEEAAESVMNGSMPSWDYTLMHPEAHLSAAETKELVAGLVATFGGEGGEGGEGGDGGEGGEGGADDDDEDDDEDDGEDDGENQTKGGPDY